MKRKTALTFRIKCILKRCREEGKWDLLSRLTLQISNSTSRRRLL